MLKFEEWKRMKILRTHQKSSKIIIRVLLLIFLLTIILALMIYANYQYTSNNPGGTDFLYRWLPTRLILFEGYQNPYSPEVEVQVEIVHHGHPRQGKETPGIFAYPFYIIPLYVPFSFISDFPTARAIWMSMLELIHLALVILTLQLFKIKLNRITLILLLLFSIFFSFYTQPIIDGNPSPIVALLVLLCLISISREKDWLAGMLLAFSTIKPQMVLLFFILVWVWAFSQRRWKIILGSSFTLLILIGGSFAIQPSWFYEFLKDVLLYPKVASPHSTITILNQWMPDMAKWVSLFITACVIFILGKEWIKGYKKEFKPFFWVVCLTFMLSPISGVSSAHSNFIATLPGFVLIIAALEMKAVRNPFLIRFFPLFLIALSWILFYFARFKYRGDYLFFYIDFIILPIVMTPVLFWLRYRSNIFQENNAI